MTRFASHPEVVDDLLQQTYVRMISASADYPAGIRRLWAYIRQRLQDVPKQAPTYTELQAIGSHVGDSVTGSVASAPPLIEGQIKATELPINLTSTPEDSEIELAQVVKIAKKLPLITRRVFALRKVYGWAPSRIAGRLGLPVKSVEQHLCTAARIYAHEIYKAIADAAASHVAPLAHSAIKDFSAKRSSGS